MPLRRAMTLLQIVWVTLSVPFQSLFFDVALPFYPQILIMVPVFLAALVALLASLNSAKTYLTRAKAERLPQEGVVHARAVAITRKDFAPGPPAPGQPGVDHAQKNRYSVDHDHRRRSHCYRTSL